MFIGGSELIIDVTNNTVSTFRQSIKNAGLKLIDNTTDEELQFILDKQTGNIEFSLDRHDKKTITGYKFIEVSEWII